jgi:hypothetical protein
MHYIIKLIKLFNEMSYVYTIYRNVIEEKTIKKYNIIKILY